MNIFENRKHCRQLNICNDTLPKEVIWPILWNQTCCEMILSKKCCCIKLYHILRRSILRVPSRYLKPWNTKLILSSTTEAVEYFFLFLDIGKYQCIFLAIDPPWSYYKECKSELYLHSWFQLLGNTSAWSGKSGSSFTTLDLTNQKLIVDSDNKQVCKCNETNAEQTMTYLMEHKLSAPSVSII